MDLLTRIVQRLAMLGYTADESSLSALRFYGARAEESLCAACNLPKLPEPLMKTAADMAAGTFLRERKAAGVLEGYDFAAAVKSLSEGDVSITYAEGATPEQQFDALLRALASPPPGLIAAYRRIGW